MNSISREEMEKEGLKEEARGTDLKPDEGFRYNPAERRWKPDPGKYNSRLREQMEKEVWD